jgi:DNA-binding transcriptional MerR regulator
VSKEFMKPAEAANRLQMPPSTLRVYSTRFSELLSPAASNPPASPDGRAGHRLYTENDIAVLAKAKNLLNRGITYDQALNELREEFPSPDRSPFLLEHGTQIGQSGSNGNVRMDALVGPLIKAVENAQKAADAWQTLAIDRNRENQELKERLRSAEGRIERLEELWTDLLRSCDRNPRQKSGLWNRLFG